MDELHELRLDVRADYRELSERIRKLEDGMARGSDSDGVKFLAKLAEALGRDWWHFASETMCRVDQEAALLDAVNSVVYSAKMYRELSESRLQGLKAAREEIAQLKFPNGDLKGLLRRVRTGKEAQDGE